MKKGKEIFCQKTKNINPFFEYRWLAKNESLVVGGQKEELLDSGKIVAKQSLVYDG